MGAYPACREGNREHYDHPTKDGIVWQCINCGHYYQVYHHKDDRGHGHIQPWAPATAEDHRFYLGMQALAEFTVEAIQRRVYL